jgi:hypothetical protein
LNFDCKENNFSPIIGTESKLGVQTVFDTKENVQFVKIQKIFPSYASSNEEKIPKILNVRINASDYSYLFKDTIINGISNYSVYYNKEIKVDPGNYMLIITSDDYPMTWSTMLVPSKPDISFTTLSDSIIARIKTNISIGSFSYHFYVDYSLVKDGNTLLNRIEVPIKVDTNEKKEISVIYPTSFKQTTVIGGTEEIFLSFGCLKYIKNFIKSKENASNVILYRGTMFIRSSDLNLSNYLRAVEGYDDPYSVRLDKPDWTNIVNGYGVFGSIRLDSSWYYIPTKINTDN